MKTRRTSRLSTNSKGTEGEGGLDRGKQGVIVRKSSNATAKDSLPVPSKKPRRSTRLSPASVKNQESPTSKSSTPSPPSTRRTKRSPSSGDGASTPKTPHKSKVKESPEEVVLANSVHDKKERNEEKNTLEENKSSPKSSPNSEAEETNKDEKKKDQCKDGDSPKGNAKQSSFYPPPVEEVITKDTNKVKASRHTHRRGGPKLDEKTLTVIKSHLIDNKADILDEDEIVNFTLRTHRIANEQTRYQMQLIRGGGRAAAKEDLTDDQQSDAGSNDTSIFADCLAEEEEHAVGHDLVKKLHSKLEPSVTTTTTITANNKSGGGSKSSMDKANGKFDKKTLLWVKRAAGLHRSSDDPAVAVGRQHSDNNKGGRMTTRRSTRKMVTDRCEKKRDKGLDVLVAAVNELEVQYGPFSIRAPRRKQKKEIQRDRYDSNSSDDETDDAVRFKRRRKKGILELEVARRLAKTKRKNSRSSKENEDPTERSSKRRKGQDTGSKSLPRRSTGTRSTERGRKRKSGSIRKQPPPKKVCTSLRVLDWMWRDRTKQFRNAEPKPETEATYRARKKIALHPQFIDAGIVHRLPRLHSFVRSKESPKDGPGRVYDPPRRRHSDLVYAQFCSRLMNCLQGQTRLFATCEFFYSDLDREWYNNNVFASEAAALGVPAHEKLTRNEWRAVRRRMIKKPRRFSKNFIVSQLNQRNEYRSTVRKLQNNPHLSDSERFPYNVFAPIRVGALVTAYSKRFRIIQRGRVLTYDRSSALYLVEFESKQFGYELCPDSEVATCGIPQILIPVALNDSLLMTSHVELGDFPSGSGTGPPPGCMCTEQLRANDGFGDLMSFTLVDCNHSERNGRDEAHATPGDHLRPRTLLDDVANHDAFITLMQAIDTARNRKNDLLALIEDATTLVVDQLPFGENASFSVELSGCAHDHLCWLQKNLEQTNQILAAAMQYLRSLYGNAYLPVRNESPGEQNLSKLLLQGALEANSRCRSTSPSDCSVRLTANSADAGRRLALSVQKYFEPQKVKIGKQINLMYDRFCAVGQLLCSASYAQNRADVVGGADCWTSVAVASNKLSTHEFPSAAGPEQLYSEVLDARDSAVKDLEDALYLLRSELELSKLKRSMVGGNLEILKEN